MIGQKCFLKAVKPSNPGDLFFLKVAIAFLHSAKFNRLSHESESFLLSLD